ncbi:hypothetical protein CLM62_02760 [Streptomyces sp. SA15]|uniref:hypothetical protein n=1 Tax=Streptomyces sp. SA15 TaxID=934019 RepID=UPI000BAE9C71|nr:hypothetical protein [Streptomyces sp. SA15]PAZ17323.1 hypothetical protein CLM62_02760 [Streptomyces sp. SA15]
MRESPLDRTAGLPHGAAPAYPPARPVEGPPDNLDLGAGEATAEQMVGMIWTSALLARHRSRG